MKFNNKLLFFAVFLSLASCDSDLLEPQTPGVLTEELAIRSSTDLTRLTNNIYVALYGRSDIEFTSVFTDEIAPGITNGGQGINDSYAFILTPASASANGIWNTANVTLARANKVIVNADRLLLDPIIGANAAQVNAIKILKAEALTLRAYAHIRLVSYFSPNPKDDAAFAGVLALTELALDTNFPRATNGATYAAIHTDLDNAIALFGTAGLNPIRANRFAARALKARAYALKGDYPNALTQANLVITASGAPALSTFSTYQSVFTDASAGETLFKLGRVVNQSAQATNLGNIYASVSSTINGSPFYEVNRALYNALPNGDVRKLVIPDATSIIDPNYLTSTSYKTTDVIPVGKHPGTPARGQLNADFKLIRMSEMHLIKAEAEVAAGQLLTAATTLKVLLDARFATPQLAPVFASAQDAWRFILNQRRIEFAFEGYRFIDLKRLGGAAFANVSIDRHPLDCTASVNCTLPVTDYRFALPIPTVETNPNPTITQNPGY